MISRGVFEMVCVWKEGWVESGWADPEREYE
jgi:hypothetical protein